MSRFSNLILTADGYKFSHPAQYPPETAYARSYFEARTAKVSPDTLFFGLQYYLKQYLTDRITAAQVDEAEESALRWGAPFYRHPWDVIVNEYGGRLPLLIRAVPEGTIVPVSNVLFTVENTVPGLHWLPSFFETLLEKVWYPITVASVALQYTRSFERAREISSDLPRESSFFKLTDFGLRGVSSAESGGIGGAALFASGQNFSDNSAGLILAEDYYNTRLANATIPAMEHATVTSWTESGEGKAFSNMLDEFLHEGSYVAMVMDSYDLFRAVEAVADREGERIKNSGGTVVFRPDSGEPTEILPQLLRLLAKKFGAEENSKGFKVLPPYVRIIQGDGIKIDKIDSIITSIIGAGFSIDNILFGSGGGLLQDYSRDTYGFAYKTSQIVFNNGGRRDVFKHPKTAEWKTSKKGDLDLVTDGKKFQTIDRGLFAHEQWTSALVPVFKDGELLVDYSLDEIRERVWS